MSLFALLAQPGVRAPTCAGPVGCVAWPSRLMVKGVPTVTDAIETWRLCAQVAHGDSDVDAASRALAQRTWPALKRSTKAGVRRTVSHLAQRLGCRVHADAVPRVVHTRALWGDLRWRSARAPR